MTDNIKLKNNINDLCNIVNYQTNLELYENINNINKLFDCIIIGTDNMPKFLPMGKKLRHIPLAPSDALTFSVSDGGNSNNKIKYLLKLWNLLKESGNILFYNNNFDNLSCFIKEIDCEIVENNLNIILKKL